MIAVNLLTGKEYKAFNPDETILKFFKDVDYYIDYGKNIALLTKIKENNIDYGHRFRHFSIDGKLYESYFTSSINELNKMYKLLIKKDMLKIEKPFQLNFEL